MFQSQVHYGIRSHFLVHSGGKNDIRCLSLLVNLGCRCSVTLSLDR